MCVFFYFLHLCGNNLHDLIFTTFMNTFYIFIYKVDSYNSVVPLDNAINESWKYAHNLGCLMNAKCLVCLQSRICVQFIYFIYISNSIWDHFESVSDQVALQEHLSLSSHFVKIIIYFALFPIIYTQGIGVKVGIH